MVHLCEKCGAEVDDGVPFCRNCGAPQIRVNIGANEPATPPLSPGTPAELQPPAEPIDLHGAPGQATGTPARVRWSQAIPGAVLAGLLLSIGLMVPYAPPFLILVAAGGFAAALYARRAPGIITAGTGARVGLVAGLFGWVVIAIVFLAELALGGGHLMAALRDAVRQQIANNPDPRAQEILNGLNSPGGLAAVITFGMVLFLLVLLACGALGGAVVGSLFRTRDKSQPRA